MHRRETDAEVPRSKFNSYSRKEQSTEQFLYLASQENADLARMAYLEDSRNLDLLDTMAALEASPMFRALVDDVNKLNKNVRIDPSVLMEFGARLYLAGRLSENIDPPSAGLFKRRV